jgi:hypothetical protein
MRKTIIATVALVSLGGIVAACDTGTSDYKHASAKAQHSAQQKAKTQAPKPSGPKATTAQSQALSSAKSYLSMGSGFSRAGLIQQLSSKAGEGFKLADAIWAVNHTGADWNAQAVESAKTYMQMGGFSRASLIEQLTSKAGEGFTMAQAEYAAHKVGY